MKIQMLGSNNIPSINTMNIDSTSEEILYEAQ